MENSEKLVRLGMPHMLAEEVDDQIQNAAGGEYAQIALDASVEAQIAALEASDSVTDAQAAASAASDALTDTEAAAAAAAASAATVTGTVVTIYQNADGTWPARPAYPEHDSVRFVGWTFPTGRMISRGDWWDRITQQFPPLAPDAASWVAANMHNGTQLSITLLSVPSTTTPPINGVRYMVDGGAPVVIPVTLPMTTPYTVEVTAAAGARSVTIQYGNTVGWGTVSTAKLVTVSADPFTDDFARTDGWVSAAPGLWRDVTIGISARRMNILSGQAGPQGANETYTVQCPDYLPLQQRMSVDVAALATSNTSSPRGLALLLRMPRYDVPMDSVSYTQITGYIARQTNAGWEVNKRLTPGAASITLPGASGSGTFPIDMPDPWDFRITAGGLITLSYNGSVLWSGTDADNIVGHYAGFRANTTTASGPTALRVDNAVVAGTF